MEKTYIPESSYKVSFLFRRILVPFDGSATAKKAASVAIDFAQRYGSRLTFLYVAPSNADKGEIDKIFEPARKMVAEAGVDAEFIVKEASIPKESVAIVIIHEAKENLYSAIIMGVRGHTEDEDISIGSTALMVSTFAPCSVLLIR